MKTRNKLFITLILAAFGLSSCGGNGIGGATDSSPNSKNNRYVSGVTLNEESHIFSQVGESLALFPNVTFVEGHELEKGQYDISWRSSDNYVATVDNNGVVICTGVGEAVISVIAGYKMAQCVVSLPTSDDPIDPYIPPQPGFSITLNVTSRTLAIRETLQLEATTSEEAEVAWSSSNEEVAKVDSHGLVAAYVKGDAVITATANGVSAKCSIHVYDPDEEEDDEKNCEFYFFIDYNNIDENDETKTKLLAKFMWYQDRPLSECPLVPAAPSEALDPAFPYFIGWSAHTVIDRKEDLWKLDSDVAGNTYYQYLYGIWSDVPAGELLA